MALIIEAPNEVTSLKDKKNLKLFLAGGITNCPDWQKIVIEELKDVPYLTIYNPRRANFPIDDPDAAKEQITWEYKHLSDSDIILFWFSRGSLNPIVLYELGKYGTSSKRPIVIGLDPKYERKQDVEIQTKLARPEVKITYSLYDLIDNLIKLIENIIEK